jgi:hypothetical protein
MSSVVRLPRVVIRIQYACAYCNKTGCRNEVKVCAKCKTTRYCSNECQENDWKDHKPQCVVLEQARKYLRGASIRMPMKMLKAFIAFAGCELAALYQAKLEKGVHGIQLVDIQVDSSTAQTDLFTFYTLEQCLQMQSRTSNISWAYAIIQIQKQSGMIVGILHEDLNGGQVILASVTCQAVIQQ